MKKEKKWINFLKILAEAFSFVLVTCIVIVITLLLTIKLFCNSKSNSVKELFVTTMLETGSLKWITNLFLSKEEIQNIVSKNSMQEMKNEINTQLITVGKENSNINDIELVEISGDTFFAKMLIIKDPSRIKLATTYPYGEYGIELHKLVNKNNAIGGINGGLYAAGQNKGGNPLGVVVKNGHIEYNATGYRGLHLIGFDTNNLLRIINVAGMSKDTVEKIVKEEKIRDAVSFQEESSDANNHFVKLIINGEKRIANGLGSGANPRTAIGQRSDGTVLLLVTDGRGASGHLGATALDLINVMEKYGAINAANLDGGSSSSMYYNGKYEMTSVTLYYSNSSWKLPTAFIIEKR